ncbi:transglycosylase SLT domain-containing protein [Candidatus Margulisiibacteriota bacterium]
MQLPQRKLILLLLFIIMLGLGAGSESHPYPLAKKHFKQKKYVSAAKYFHKSKKHDRTINDYADYYLALIPFNQKNYSKAYKAFTAFQKKYPKSALKGKAEYSQLICTYRLYGPQNMPTDSLMSLAKNSWSNGEYDRAGHIWRWILGNRPRDDHQEKVLSNLAKYEFRKRRHASGRRYLTQVLALKGPYSTGALYNLGEHDKLLEQYPTSNFADDILYSRALRSYLRKDYKGAEKNFNRIVSDHPDGNYHAAAMYWLAKTYKRRGNKTKYWANIAELREKHPYRYWGIKAAKLLGVKPPSLAITPIPEKYSRLIQLGCYDDAGVEIRGACRKDKDNMLFIMPFWQNLTRYAKKHGMDPHFVAAIMREESRFNPAAVSRCGAIGLMQLMPKTAQQLARETRRGKVSKNRLFNPYFNLQLGIRYLQKLKKRYFIDDVSILAGYNAGPNAIWKWKKRFSWIRDEDEFIERMPYRETRNYVKKVLRSYWLYKAAKA